MLLFTVIAVAIDSSEKADDFVKADLPTSQIITEYYLGFVPVIWSMLFPLFVFIAVIFFTSRMANRSEIIAILASGTTYNRFLRPYLVTGLLLAAFLWAGTRYFIPKANIIRSDFHTNYLDKHDPTKNRFFGICERCFYRRVDSNTYVGIRDFDTSSKSAAGFFMEKVKGNQVIYNLRSQNLRWEDDKKGWLALGAEEKFVDSLGERITFHDSMWVKLPLKPEELRKDEYLKDKLTTPELIRYIKQEEFRGNEGLKALKVERYRRSATSFTVLLLTIIGVVIASRKTRGGSGIHLALGITIAAFFIIADRFSTVFATKGNLPPLIAAWLPNIVFSVVAFILYRRTPK